MVSMLRSVWKGGGWLVVHASTVEAYHIKEGIVTPKVYVLGIEVWKLV